MNMVSNNGYENAGETRSVNIRDKNFDVSGLIDRVSDPKSGLNLALEAGGLRLSQEEYKPGGYGFIRIHGERIDSKPIVTIEYDTGTRMATQITRWVPDYVSRGLLIPVLEEPSGTVSKVFDYLSLPKSISDDERFSCDRYISRLSIDERKTSLILPENSIQLPSLQELINLGKQTGIKMFDLSDDVIVQGEYSIGKWSSLDPKERPEEYRSPRTIRTFGVGPCVALALHNEHTLTGAFFHIDYAGQLNRRIAEPITQAANVIRSWTDKDRRQGKHTTKPKAKLIGGINNFGSKKTIVGIHECLRANDVEVEGQKILQGENYDIVFDLFTGKVFTYNPEVDSSREDIKTRLLQASLHEPTTPLRNIAPRRRIE